MSLEEKEITREGEVIEEDVELSKTFQLIDQLESDLIAGHHNAIEKVYKSAEEELSNLEWDGPLGGKYNSLRNKIVTKLHGLNYPHGDRATGRRDHEVDKLKGRIFAIEPKQRDN